MRLLRSPAPVLACVLVVTLAWLAPAPSGRAQDDGEPPSPSVELLANLGVRANPEPGVRKLLDQYASAHPDVPHDFWRAIYEYHSHPGPLRDALGAVVEREMSAQEIETALAFFRSEVGRKVVQVREKLAEESPGIARKLANEFRDDVRARLRAAGRLE